MNNKPKLVCSWCVPDNHEIDVSHGICPEHLEQELRGLTRLESDLRARRDARKRLNKEVLEFAAGVLAGILLLGLAVLGMLAL